VHIRRRGETQTKYWWGNQKGKWHLEYTDVDVGIILKVSLKRLGDLVWIGFIWLKMENDGRIF
jgi:hypothetical protein